MTELVMQVLSIFGAVAGCYAAIRADLTRAIVTAEHACKAAGEAHGRLDLHLQQHHQP